MFTPKVDRISYGGAIIGLEEVQAVMNCMLTQGGTRWTVGENSVALERELAKEFGVQRSVLTNSGSSALLVALTSLHLPKGSKVIIPAVNFPTAFNAILQCGCVPVVVDVDLKTLNISLKEVERAIETYPDIKAIFAVHIAANPVNLIELRKIVGERYIISDNCLAKGTLVLTNKGEVPIEKIKIGDMVMTRKGYKKVLNTMYKGIQPVITKFGVTATSDHKFITTKGKKELNVLKPSDILFIWNKTLLSIEEKTTSDILMLNKDTEGFTIGVEINHIIGSFTKIILEKYQKATSFITKTTIRLITSYQIYNVLHQNNTLTYISKKREGSILHKGTSLLQEIKRLSGINLMQENNFMPNITSGFGVLGKQQLNNVMFVNKTINRITPKNQSFAHESVSQKAEVYDLTVEDAHEFFANGVLVSNCDGSGTTFKGKYIDEYADLSCVSFHAAHIITMGEGGAVLTNNVELADRCLKLREWGRASGTDDIYEYEGFPEDYRSRYVYEEIGFNMKPLELQCAMGRVQLKKMLTFKEARKKNYQALKEIFATLPRFKTVESIEDSDPCWFSFPILCDRIPRKKVFEAFESNNIECRTIFSGNITRHPAYKHVDYYKMDVLANADYVMKNGMFLSVHPSITPEMIEFIGEVARDVCAS